MDGPGDPGVFGRLAVQSAGGAEAGVGVGAAAGAGEAFVEGEVRGVLHRVLRFESTSERAVLASENERLFAAWGSLAGGWRPDAVLTFGGFLYNKLVLAEARRLGARTGFYLAAPGYRDREAFDFADRIFAVSEAIARECGVDADPRLCTISSLIDLDAYRVPVREPSHVVFVNPQPAKGLAVFGAVARLSQRLGREHRFLVVESRGTWESALAQLPWLRELRNVTVLPRQDDMRAVYRVAQALMFPSLWPEAAGRVLREAGINGIPVLAHRVGGVAETVPDGLALLEPPAPLLDDWLAPVPDAFAQAWLGELDRLHADPTYYAAQSERIRAAVQGYSLEALVARVEAGLAVPSAPLSTLLAAPPSAPSAASRSVPSPAVPSVAAASAPAGGAGGSASPEPLAASSPASSEASPTASLAASPAMGSIPATRRRILCASLRCVLDAGSDDARRLRGLLQGLAVRGHDVRVLCGSALQPPGDVRLLLATPQSGHWREAPGLPQREIRGGALHGVVYRVLRLESDDAARARAREEQALFLALLDAERGWQPQALITGDDSLFSRLLRRRAEHSGIPVAAWSGDRLRLAGPAPAHRGSALDLLEAALCGGPMPLG